MEDLNKPLPGESAAVIKVTQETIDQENAGFDALMGATGGR